MAKIAKRVFIDVPGVGRLESLPGATFNPGGFSREAVIADVGVVGHSEEPVAPTLQCRLPNGNDLDMNVLRNLQDVNVTVQDDNGQTWIIRDAWTNEPPELSSGEVSLNMTGVSADPVN